MKLQLASDLHLERYPNYQLPKAEQAEVLVLAGDIGSYQAGSLLPDAEFGLRRFSPHHAPQPWKHVVFVPGNHEFDALDRLQTGARLRELCAQLEIQYLDQDSLILDGVRFVGTTLWSDFQALAMLETREAARADALQKALRAANFYLRKNTTLEQGRPMLAPDIQVLGQQAQAWLRSELARPHAGPTVVVSHFAPTLHSADPRYGHAPGTAGFCNGLDDLLPYAQLWLHGHLHCAQAHVIGGRLGTREWRCEIRANARGYASKNEQAQFDEHCVIEVPMSTCPPLTARASASSCVSQP